MNSAVQNLLNEGVAGKIFQSKELWSSGTEGMFPVLGTGWYCSGLNTIRHFSIHGWAELWKTWGMVLRGKGIKIFWEGLTGVVRSRSGLGNDAHCRLLES